MWRCVAGGDGASGVADLACAMRLRPDGSTAGRLFVRPLRRYFQPGRTVRGGAGYACACRVRGAGRLEGFEDGEDREDDPVDPCGQPPRQPQAVGRGEALGELAELLGQLLLGGVWGWGGREHR